jgi:phosphohistidine phosphatase
MTATLGACHTRIVSDSKTLVVVRHAKAEQSGPTDFERQLADRGLEDAAEAGRWLAARGVTPDAAIVSAAVRTEQTWDAVSEAAGWDVDPHLEEGLYEAGTESALDLVRESEASVTTLVVVGHNPTMASLAQLLDDGDGDDDAGNEMAMGFPTASVAVLEYDGEWAELDEAGATLVAFHVGRG